MGRDLEPILYRESAVETLHELFCERVRRTPGAFAYRCFDESSAMWVDKTWHEMFQQVTLCAQSLIKLGVNERDRCVILLANSPDWVCADQAALSLNMVTVPLFHNDRPENMAHVIKHSQARFLILGNTEQWELLQPLVKESCLQSVVLAGSFEVLWARQSKEQKQAVDVPAKLATIIYTSGTTGNPKGVMLSHANILENASAGYAVSTITPDDLFLSFLPLSHAFERTVGYYLPMMAGAKVAFARSILTLQEDLVAVSPTVIVTVPRMFEKINERLEEKLCKASALKRLLVHSAEEVGFKQFLYLQKRAGWQLSQLFYPLLDKMVGSKVRLSLGGRLRLAISGGAPLSFLIAKRYIGFGVPIIQGYGLTECAPVVSGNRLERNEPKSVGAALLHTELRIDENSGELLVKGPGIMMGYWLQPEATDEVIDKEGWFHTGDLAKIVDEQLYITGRIKDILVLSNGEKVPPADVEEAIMQHPWIDQVMVVGECRPHLVALIVPSKHGAKFSKEILLKRVDGELHAFPGYEKVKDIIICSEPWTIEEGLLTPTMKLRRQPILEKYAVQLEDIYKV